MISLILGLAVAYFVYLNPYSDGAQMIYIGAAMNFVAVSSNGWQMPVIDSEITQKGIDEKDSMHFHVLGDQNTNFKPLCDWIDLGIGIVSPGDLMMLFGTFYNLTGFKLVSNGKNLTLKYEHHF